MWLLSALLVPSAQGAMQKNRSGPTFELAVGPGMAGTPVRFAVAGQLTTGWWFGPYDDSYALGRFWALALTQRFDYLPSGGASRYAPMFEIRRGMDLFVIAPHLFLAGGPVVDLAAPGRLGGTLRAGGGLKFRRTRRTGIVGRLEAGADLLGGAVSPVVAVTFGVGWSTPYGGIDD